MWNWIRRPKNPRHVDHVVIREIARLERVRADARLLLHSYYTHGWLSRRRVRSMGQRRWQAAYRLLKCSGLLDPVNGHPRTRSFDRAVMVVDEAAADFRAKLEESNGRYTLPF